MDWVPEGGDEPGYYNNVLESDYSNWGQYIMTRASVLASELSVVLILLDLRGPFVDNNIALANKIVFVCQPAVVMCPNFFQETPWVTVYVDDPKKDYDDNENYVKRYAEGRTDKEWRSLHGNYRVNVDVRAEAATLIERYGVMLVAVFGACYGVGRALEAAAGWLPSPTSCVVVV